MRLPSFALAIWLALGVFWGLVFFAWLPAIPYAAVWVLGAVFAADAGSYVFHYLIDHYGRPVPGGLVHEFQRHHLIPNGIVQKRVDEVLFPAVRIVLPLQLLMTPMLLNGWLPPLPGLLLWVLMSCWVLAQLFHRWSHMRVQGSLAWAQRLGLIVSQREHAQHHKQPFDSRFAVITGWSNKPLDFIGAPRVLDAFMQVLGKPKRGLVRSLEEISGTSGLR